ncbi:MAG: acyl carrier protein [Candidatus Brocadiia bacterium]
MAVDRSEVERRVKATVARVLDLEPEQVTDESNFIFDLGADSQQSVEMVAAFEEEFDIEMDEDEALAVQNVRDAVEFISEILDQ